MKKTLKIFMLHFVFLSQVVFGGFFVVPAIAVIPLIISQMIKDSERRNSNAKYIQDKYEERVKSGSAGVDKIKNTFIIRSELGNTIDESIDVIINQTITIKNKQYPLFPTTNSKIFVLKNIQDFFNFKYPDLNQFVYEECIKKINNLQKNLEFKVIEEKGYLWGETFTVEKYVDTDPEFQAIDDARDKYMIEYDLSSQKLKYMEEVGKENKAELNTMLTNKIDTVTNGLKEKIRDAADWEYKANHLVFYQGQNWDNFKKTENMYKDRAKFDENSPEYKAHISILAHLIYWQSQNKSDIFIPEGEELLNKARIVEEKEKNVEALREEYTNKSPETISAPQGQQEMRERLARQYVGMKFAQKPIEQSQESQQAMDERAQILGKLRTNKPIPVSQPAQQSYWSRLTSTVKSWFGW